MLMSTQKYAEINVLVGVDQCISVNQRTYQRQSASTIVWQRKQNLKELSRTLM